MTYLDPDELKTTWVGNKGIYRTRMAVADGGDLIILAPGVKAFGENEEMDKMTRKYGYKGRDYVLDLFNKGAFDNKIMSVRHLIQVLPTDVSLLLTAPNRKISPKKKSTVLATNGWITMKRLLYTIQTP